MTLFVQYLKTRDILEAEDKGWVKKVACYILVGDEVFTRGYSQHLLNCITLEQDEYIIHECI